MSRYYYYCEIVEVKIVCEEIKQNSSLLLKIISRYPEKLNFILFKLNHIFFCLYQSFMHPTYCLNYVLFIVSCSDPRMRPSFSEIMGTLRPLLKNTLANQPNRKRAQQTDD